MACLRLALASAVAGLRSACAAPALAALQRTTDAACPHARTFTTLLRAPCGPSAAVAPLLLPRVHSALAHARGYKFYTPHLMAVPVSSVRLGPAAAAVNRATQEARMVENWRAHRYYVKPKYRRQNVLHLGIFKRKRVEFNRRLRWALKTMKRCASQGVRGRKEREWGTRGCVLCACVLTAWACRAEASRRTHRTRVCCGASLTAV